MRRKILEIEWGDAFIESDDFDQEDADKTEPCWRTTVGWLVSKNQHGYVLATDVYRKEPEANAKMFIPHGMIESVFELDQGKCLFNKHKKKTCTKKAKT